MIFKIADGREYFYQWDIDRQIIVSDPTITEVHFCNRTDVCSLVVEVEEVEVFADNEKALTLRTANVPNKLLQSGFDVRVFGYDGKATMHEATFEVKARTQPTDYVYTETEIKRYSDLEKRIDEIEKEGISEEVITKAVNNYLDENPITMDGYATEEYVNEAVGNIEIPEVDFTGYATEAYVDEAVKNAKVDVDLTDYAKKTDIPDVSDFISEIPDEYITESELSAKGYATKAELNDKANANHTHTGYAKTTHTHSAADVDGLQKALNEKATQADIDKAIELHDHRYDYAPIDHSHGDEYAAKSHVHSYNSLLDKPTIPSVEGLASEAYVNAAVKNAKPNLTGYATEKYVDDAIANIDIPEQETEIAYFTSNITTEATVGEEVEAALAAGKLPVYKMSGGAHLVYAGYSGNILVFTGTAVNPKDTSDSNLYYALYDKSTKNWKATSHAVPLQKKLFVNLDGASETLTSLTVDGKTYAIPQGGDVDLSNYYTKEETYSKAEVDDAIANIEIPAGPGGEAPDLSNYYTKDETDELISNINECDTYFFNAEAVEWQNRGPTPAPASLAEFAQRVLAGEAVNLCVAQIVEGNVRWVPAEFYITKTTSNVSCVEFEQGVSVSDIGKEGIIQPYRVYPEATVGWAVTKLSSFPKFIADKTYVDEAIQTALSGIATAEGGAY